MAVSGISKIKSLLLCDLISSRKKIIYQLLLLVVFGAFYCYGTVSMDKGGDAEIKAMIVMLSCVLCELLALTNVVQADTFLADMKSGWLKSSYAFAVTPHERAVSIIIKKNVISLLGMIIGMLFTAGLCAISGIAFSAYFAVLNILIFCALQIAAIVCDNVVYSVRTEEELKKKMLVFQIVIVVPVFVLIFFFVSHADSIKDYMIGLFDKLDNISALNLLWIIPLAIVFIIADYFVIRHRLAFAYSGRETVSSNKSEKKAVIINSAAHFKGLLYNELRLNRGTLIGILAIPVCCILFVLIVGPYVQDGSLKDFLSDERSKAVYIAFVGLSAYTSSLILGGAAGDNEKQWANFIISTAEGVKGYMFCKYVFCFAMNFIYMVMWNFMGSVYDTVCYAVTGIENTSISMVYLIIFYCLLFVLSFDIPLSVRFGQKKGSIIKCIAMLVLAFAFVMIFSILPESVQNGFYEFAVKVIDGEIDSAPVIVSLFPIAGMVLYYFSYKFSCRLFVKGANSYE